MDTDVVVVGGGPAGLAAALWLGRYRRPTVLLDSGEYRNLKVDRAHGYLGSDPFDPAALRERAREQISAYPDVILRDERAEGVVVASEADGGGFCVATATESITCRRLVLATGVRDELPDVEGIEEFYGSDVFHCPTCDGFEAQGRAVVVFGWSEAVAGFANLLRNWAESVTVITDGHRFEGDDAQRAALVAQGVALLEDEAVRLNGRRGDLRSVRLRGGGDIPCQLAFFTIAHRPASTLAADLGCDRAEGECVTVDGEGLTSRRNVYAAGDMTPGLQLVQVAAAKGAVAGVACARSLRPDLERI